MVGVCVFLQAKGGYGCARDSVGFGDGFRGRGIFCGDGLAGEVLVRGPDCRCPFCDGRRLVQPSPARSCTGRPSTRHLKERPLGVVGRVSPSEWGQVGG